MRFLRIKALFMVLVLIISIFSIYILNTKEVNAQQNVCCEKTNSGEFCQYTSQNNCDTNYNIIPTTCGQTAFCQLVCCIDTNTGEVFPNVFAASCYNQPNKTINANNPSCNNIPRGCCQVGNQCSIRTESNCNYLASQFGIDPNFNPNINNEAQCINQCQAQDEGCCVQQGTCEYTTRGECSVASQTNPQGTLGFYQNTYCSSPSLNCNCDAHARKGCLPEEEDVYWFDSCGNPEETAEDCDYIEGTLCKESGGSASCASVNCLDTTDFTNNIFDPNMGGFRKNGESWCVYEGAVGPSLDLVGSRHYRHLCVNGEELTEPCEDFRRQYCLQGTLSSSQGSYTEGSCVENKFNECIDICNTVKDKKGKEQIRAINNDRNCCQSKPYCLWSGEQDGAGVCLPLVPPGLKFWEENGEEDQTSEAKNVCDLGDRKCKSVWEKTFSGWECKVNCQCETKKWVNDINSLCRSYGDCGAHYNVVGVLTTGGQDSYGGKTKKLDTSLIQDFESFWLVSKGLLINGSLEGSPYTINPYPGSGSAGISTSNFMGYPITLFRNFGKSIAGDFGGFIGTITGLIFTIHLWWFFYLGKVVFGFGDTKSYVHHFDCEPWTAPTGGSGCEKCGGDSNFECTEYRCKSLGSACQLINEGTTEQGCVDSNPNDVNSPVISPWHETLSFGYNIELTETGYLITPLVPAYAQITFGIELNEVAQCKVDTKHTQSYDEMIDFFGRSLYQDKKNITLVLAGNKDYTYYIRCQDTHGNKNIAEYTIQLSADKEPDMTAPIIDHTSIVNNAFLPTGITETDIILFVNEPSQCKWSKTDEDYQFMQHNMACELEEIEIPTFFNLYECDGLLTELISAQDNKFYFRCEDLSGNKNQQSYSLTLKGTVPLNIISSGPSGELFTSSPALNVITQNGAESGKAICEFSNNNINFIEFINTNSNTHTQPLINLTLGEYNYYIKCSDVAGNEATSNINFIVSVDELGPVITYIYVSGGGNQTGGGVVTIITNE
ncbi:MAG: hypothetical protein AABY07_04025, partial [Nanoarchaeota archaeon]